MKLYECPRNVQVRVIGGELAKTPIGSPRVEGEEIINFKHVDGMYSLCTNQKGETVHLAAWTEVEIV